MPILLDYYQVFMDCCLNDCTIITMKIKLFLKISILGHCVCTRYLVSFNVQRDVRGGKESIIYRYPCKDESLTGSF